VSNTQHTLSPAPPWHITTGVTWLSAEEMAVKWSRTGKTIRQWCKDGTLIAAHCRVYKDFKGRWWIGVPDAQVNIPHLKV
jgi:hypothetical protein